MKVTVVIPALNEEATIGAVITEARPYCDEVIVMDGGSCDATVATSQSAGARIESDGGGGKGVAIRRTPHVVPEGIVVFMDADGSHEAKDIPLLVAPIREGRADHVVASRLRGGSSELHGGFDEFLRLTGSAFITACINWKFGVRLSDSQNGFRALRADFLAGLPLRSSSTTIEQEMTAQTLRKKGRIEEVPSHEHPRRAGKSHIDPVRDSLKYLWSLIRDVMM